MMLSRYRGRTTCTSCQGKRLRKETQYVKINGKSINDLVDMPVDELLQFMQTLQLSTHEHQIAERLLVEINNRLDFFVKLDYLTLRSIGNRIVCPAENPNESTWQPRLAVAWLVQCIFSTSQVLAYIQKIPNA